MSLETDDRPSVVADGGRDSAALRTSPYHDRQGSLDAVFYDAGGWAGVKWYEYNERLAADYDLPYRVAPSTAVGVEHLGTRSTVGCYDLTPHRPIEIRGRLAGEFVQHVYSNDMDIEVGGIRFALLLSEDGGILGDHIVTRLDDERYLAIASPVNEHDVEWLRNRAPRGVTVIDRDSVYAGIGLWGPDASAVAGALTENDMSNSAFPFFTTQRVRLGGVPVTAMRLSAVGELGWELWTPVEFGTTLWDELWAVGADYGMVPVGDRAFSALTAEKGNRQWGTDVTVEHTPYEAGFAHAVDMDTDFIGKDALQRHLADGVERTLACLTLDGVRNVPDVGAGIRTDGEVIGTIVRSEYGFSIDEGIGFSYLPTEYGDPGTSLVIEGPETRYSATVREEPLFDAENDRPLV
ncbi:MAG: aminomethyltransferase family protein [Halolamina sp.]